MDNKIIIRTASAVDAPALLKIYRPYVENTAITFEYDVPSTEEFASRIQRTLKKYPYLVAEEKGTLLGYGIWQVLSMKDLHMTGLWKHLFMLISLLNTEG